MVNATQHPRSRLTPQVTDALIAAALLLFSFLDFLGRPLLFSNSGPRPGGASKPPPAENNPFAPQHHATPLSYLLVIAAFAPLALRRRFPMTVLVVTTVAAAIYQAFPNPPSLIVLGPLIAVYTVGAEGDRKTLLISAAVVAAVLIGSGAISSGVTTLWADSVRVVAIVGVAAAIGDASRTQKAYLAAVELRANEAERTREEEARRRVDEERLRIARELHDVVAHSLSVIAVQSGAAAQVVESDPAQALRSLDAIRLTSREALDELRSMLGVLRAEGDTDAPRAPVPGLARVRDLGEPLRAAGFDVEMLLEGPTSNLPALVDASAYRLVQEALTNVVRHAGPCRVAVTIRREVRSLDVRVEDDGRGTDAPSAGGHGLAGMRERVTALGGTFEAGPRPGGGFAVHAHLPLSERGGVS